MGSDTDRIEAARALVAALKAGDTQVADELVGRLASYRDRALFVEIGHMTRELHTKIAAFANDARVVRLTTEDIPDARKRLAWVVEKTAASAHTTLEMIERSLPLTGQVVTAVEGFQADHPHVDLARVLKVAQGADTALQDNLSDALMAQDYQDLTGQIIHQVIDLVTEVEQRLAGLLRLSGDRVTVAPRPQAPALSTEPVTGSTLDGPRVAGVMGEDAVDSQDDVDALLSAFGF